MTPPPRKTPSTDRGETDLVAIQAELDRHRADAAELVDKVDPSFRRYAQNILTEYDRMTPQMVRDERQQAAEHALRRQDAERQRMLDEFLASRGRRYHSCNVDNYVAKDPRQQGVLTSLTAYLDSFSDHLSRGDGLLLFGPAGTGKDHLLVSAARLAIRDHGVRVVWRNGADLFGDMRDRIGSDASERELLVKLVSPDVLYLSDPLPPYGSLTEFQAATLFRAVDRRYSLGKPTWVSLNVASRKEAAERMGPQIVDRLTDGALVLHCDWPSYRQPAPSSKVGRLAN